MKMDKGAENFSPLYERLAALFPGYLIGKLLISAGLGGGFFAIHVLAARGAVLQDWSWLLATLITVAMLCLYYATDTLRGLLPMMSLRLRQGGVSDQAFMVPLGDRLLDRYFVAAGLVFGLANCGVGFLFGLPEDTHLTLYVGFFLAGFVCGMAAWGIYAVVIALTAFGRCAKGGLDYTAPDHCGGVQFLGEGLVVFSSVTLIVGVMISLYILKVPWEYEKHPSVIVLMGLWTAFPFLLSLVILVGPAVPLNEALRQFKVEQEVLVLDDLARISRELKNPQLDAAGRKALLEEAASQKDARKELYAMGTWPHGLSANLKYLGIFLANLVASANTFHSALPAEYRW